MLLVIVSKATACVRKLANMLVSVLLLLMLLFLILMERAYTYCQVILPISIRALIHAGRDQPFEVIFNYNSTGRSSKYLFYIVNHLSYGIRYHVNVGSARV